TSVFAPFVISLAVAFTIPSVGRNLVGRKKCSNSSRSPFGALLGADRSTAQILVAIWLVSLRIGLTPDGNSAAMIPSASPLLSTILPVTQSQLMVFASVFWQDVSI